MLLALANSSKLFDNRGAKLGVSNFFSTKHMGSRD